MSEVQKYWSSNYGYGTVSSTAEQVKKIVVDDPRGKEDWIVGPYKQDHGSL